MGLQHLRQLGDAPGHFVRLSLEAHRNEGEHAEPEGVRVDTRRVAHNDAARDELLDALVHARLAEPDALADGRLRHAPVPLQEVEDLEVYGIEVGSHAGLSRIGESDDDAYSN